MVSLENALNVDIHYKKKKAALNVDMQPKKKKDFAFRLFPHAQPGMVCLKNQRLCYDRSLY